jgi:hypothetical protein
MKLTQGYRSWAEVVRAARKRGIHMRPNTITDVLRGSSNIDTYVTLARALEVPLWTFYVTDAEEALFTAALAQQTARVSEEAVREAVLAKLPALLDTALREARGAAAPTAADPTVVTLKPRKRAVP